MAKKGFGRSLSTLTDSMTGMDAIMQDARPQVIAIDQIALDPAQARRAMPDDLRDVWIEGNTSPGMVFTMWNDRAIDEVPNLNEYWTQILNPPALDRPVKDDELDAINFDKAPAARQWMQMVRLAADILESGLQQRVAVYEVGNGYRLLFGERRFLAFNFQTATACCLGDAGSWRLTS